MPLLCQTRTIADAGCHPSAADWRSGDNTFTPAVQTLDLRRFVRNDRRVFKDRSQAGAGLAAALPDLRMKSNVTVVGLARGGVEVASAAANLLQLPLDVLCIRKVGMPGYPELAMGAVAPQ